RLCPALPSPAIDSRTGPSSGWDSIHVFEATDRARTCHYKLTSTVILHLSTGGGSSAGTGTKAGGEMDLSGNMTRQVEETMAVDSETSHVANIGRLVEDMEFKMRNLLQEVYFGKAKDIVADLRSSTALSVASREKAAHQDVINSMRG
ncbi:F-actin-capping protein subunit beta, partial [Ascosphaera acerosa]